MTTTLVQDEPTLLPVLLKAEEVVVVGSGTSLQGIIRQLLEAHQQLRVTIIAEVVAKDIEALSKQYSNLQVFERQAESEDFREGCFAIIATGSRLLDEKMQAKAKAAGALCFLPDGHASSDFLIEDKKPKPASLRQVRWLGMGADTERSWQHLTSRLVFVFLLMVIGHIIISYLPMPSLQEIGVSLKPYFNYQFGFFVLAGFLAQMVDGLLSMGYGVTSATCLMSFGVSPVSVSAAIHTSEIFTTGVSGYSHYRFGNVNKKLFRHLVIPGVLGAILGALALVFLGEHYGKWLMPVIAVYAGFLGVKILIKAFQLRTTPGKVKRVGWLAGVGGFLDSFGGGGWGPIVTSSLIAKGRSPKYTIGSVSLTEFFVTLASAFTFFMTVGVSHWNVVLGLLIGGSIAAPIAARFAGRLPRKTMMILVGIMVIIWCARMIVKSLL